VHLIYIYNVHFYVRQEIPEDRNQGHFTDRPSDSIVKCMQHITKPYSTTKDNRHFSGKFVIIEYYPLLLHPKIFYTRWPETRCCNSGGNDI